MLSRRTLLLTLLAAATAAAAGRPKLVVVLVVDQLRYDYLERFGEDYRGGIARLLEEGAVFTNAHFEQAPTFTAVGHSVIFTGAFPSVSGIVGNEWYDRTLKRQVTSVSDDGVALLGAPGSGASPHRLLAPTIGDALKRAGKSRVISMSLKDRSAILPGGRSADAAYWYDAKTGNVVSSTYYMKELPAWVRRFNARRLVDQFAGRDWAPLTDGAPLVRLPAGGPEYFDRLTASPFGNDLLAELAKAAVREERLGRGPGTDLLAVSFSSNDYVGHLWGPDSPHVRDITLRTDLLLGDFLGFLEEEVGRENLLVVLTSDHGVSPIPEELPAGRGGRITEKTIREAIEKRLSDRFGEGPWVVGRSGPAPYLNHELARQRNIALAALRREAAEAVRRLPGVARVYTAEELVSGRGGDEIDRRVRNGYHTERGADLVPVAERFWVFGAERATHGSPHDYDAHVPVIFHGPGVRAGRYDRRIAINDIAPTLAALIGLPAPGQSAGKALREALR